MATYRIYEKDKNMNGHEYFLFPKKTNIRLLRINS
jgi:hypothetical protein